MNFLKVCRYLDCRIIGLWNQIIIEYGSKQRSSSVGIDLKNTMIA